MSLSPRPCGNVRYLDTVVKVFENRMYQSAKVRCAATCTKLADLYKNLQ